jgi:hypothetical protein
MARSAYLFAVSLVLFGGAVAVPPFTVAQEHPVVAEELVKLRASGKVLTALWTARKDVYTLQLVLPVSVTAPPGPVGMHATRQVTAVPPRPQAQPAHVQVWLLRPDGTQILPLRQSSPPEPARLTCPRCISYEVSYTFPLAAGREAVAAAVMINDDFYIDRLTPLID